MTRAGLAAAAAAASAAGAGAVGVGEAGRVTGTVVPKGTKIGRLVGTDAASFFFFLGVCFSFDTSVYCFDWSVAHHLRAGDINMELNSTLG